MCVCVIIATNINTHMHMHICHIMPHTYSVHTYTCVDHMHMSSCHITLATQAREIKKLNRQRDQAIKQARHWQAQAQQQRAKVCKLEAENKELLQWVLQVGNENEDEQQRQNFPPGVPLPSRPVSDFQDDPPVLAPKQPVGPPPSYLIRSFYG